MLEVGVKAPDFKLPDQNGDIHTLDEFKGKKMLLYFYPMFGKKKKNYGKVLMGVVRTTYLIDEQGIIIFANDKVKAAEDAVKMLEHLG